MARQEQDREDLLREATALVARVELRVTPEAETVVAGFRSQGAASFYFGAAPVYQFTTSGQVRRGCDSLGLLKAERGALVRLTRERTADASLLVNRPLSISEQQQWLFAARERLRQLEQSLKAGDFTVIGQVPAEGPVVQRVTEFLARLSTPLRCADDARVK